METFPEKIVETEEVEIEGEINEADKARMRILADFNLVLAECNRVLESAEEFDEIDIIEQSKKNLAEAIAVRDEALEKIEQLNINN